MKPWTRGLLIAVLQVGLVTSLGGKFLFDRLTQPRVWVQAEPYGSSLPVRGRYIRLHLLVALAEKDEQTAACLDTTAVKLTVRGNKLIATPVPKHPYNPVDLHLRSFTQGTIPCTVLDKTVAFFIPENLPETTLPRPGRELWVEVSVPPSGLPRPIRLGQKEGNGLIIPLESDN